MSSSEEMNAWSPTAERIQKGACSSSSREHHQVPVHRDDRTVAMREAVLEECIGTGKTGSPSPGGGQQKHAGLPGPGGRKNSKSNQDNNRVNQSQQAAGAATRNANLVASLQNVKSSAGNKSDTADSLERGSSPTRTSSRRRTTVKKFTGEEQISACEWKKRMGLICTRECTCRNSIPQREEERVSKMRGMDVAADSWGVVANTDIQAGEILTVFGGTTYVLCSFYAPRQRVRSSAKSRRKWSLKECLFSTRSKGTSQRQARSKYGQSRSRTRNQCVQGQMSRCG